MEGNIYDMKCNETIETDGETLGITRVPGGWIYDFHVRDPSTGGWRTSCCFVPYSEEFI